MKTTNNTYKRESERFVNIDERDITVEKVNGGFLYTDSRKTNSMTVDDLPGYIRCGTHLDEGENAGLKFMRIKGFDTDIAKDVEHYVSECIDEDGDEYLQITTTYWMNYLEKSFEKFLA